MTGGGFGGCTVALVQVDKVSLVMKKIQADYKQKTGITPTMFVSRPGQGATVLKGEFHSLVGNPPMSFNSEDHSHRRFNPLLGQKVLVWPHRDPL